MAMLRLDQPVSLAQLQRFANDAEGRNVRLRTEDGVKVLYTSAKRDFGIRNFFTGHSAKREEKARVEIARLLEPFDGAARNAKADFRSPGAALPRGRAVSGGTLKETVRTTADAQPAFAAAAHALAMGEADRPGANLAKRLAAALPQDAPKTSRAEMALLLVGPGDPHPIKDRLFEGLRDSGVFPEGLADRSYGTVPKEVRAFIDAAFTEVARAGDFNRAADNGDPPAAIRIDGKQYRHDKLLGSGATGDVRLYREENGPGTLAVKFPKGIDDTDEASKHELAMHLRADRNGDAAIGLKGAFRVASGIATAMECAPLGDVKGIAAAVDAAVKDGTLSAEAAEFVRLTLLRDMANGLAQTAKNGVVHFDVKGDNFFVTESGTAKIGDFGAARAGMTAAEGLLVHAKRVDATGTLGYIAPEVADAKLAFIKESNAHTDQKPQLIKRFGAMHAAELKLPGDHPEVQDAVNRDLRNLSNAIKGRAFAATDKADVFSLGVAAHRMFHQDALPGPLKPLQTLEEKDHVSMALAAAVRHGTGGQQMLHGNYDSARGGLAPLGAADRLLNRMMAPAAELRPSASQLADDAVLKLPGVGAPEVRKLIAALGRGADRSTIADLGAKAELAAFDALIADSLPKNGSDAFGKPTGAVQV